MSLEGVGVHSPSREPLGCGATAWLLVLLLILSWLRAAQGAQSHQTLLGLPGRGGPWAGVPSVCHLAWGVGTRLLTRVLYYCSGGKQQNYKDMLVIFCCSSICNPVFTAVLVNAVCVKGKGAYYRGRGCHHQALLRELHSRRKWTEIASGMSLACRMAPDWRLLFGPLWCVEEQELPVPILLTCINRGGWRERKVAYWFSSFINAGCSPL